MSIAKIQKGDKVKVISGNYKGYCGLVTKVLKKTKANGKIIKSATVAGIPTIVNYRKSSTYMGEKIPGIMNQVDRKINITNLALLTSDNIISRTKIENLNGIKTRVYLKTGMPVVKETIK